MAGQSKKYENDFRTLEGVKQNLKDIESLEKKGLNSAISKNQLLKEKLQFQSRGLDIEKKITSIQDSVLGKLLKKEGLEKKLLILNENAQKGTKKEQKEAQKLLDNIHLHVSGQIDNVELVNRLAQDYGSLNVLANEFGNTIANAGEDLEDTVSIGAKLKERFDSVLFSLTGINIEQTLSAAGALAIIGSFASKVLDIKQSLGTSAVESARVAGNMTAAGVAARMMGGSAQEAEAAVTAMVDEFGTLNVLSLETSLSLGAMVADTGLTGANAAKLLKSMEAIGTSSIETNMNLISATAELARAEGVAPAQVLNDIAESTEMFAHFAKDGGKNIAAAAIAARKLGLNLGTVASIAESLLDFESSIGAEMEASVLLGRQLSLDKARELALTGDLAGLAEEVKNQVGSQAEFEAMNVVQRKHLAAAIGVSASDLGKMVAGEKTSAEMAEEKNRQQEKFIGLQKLAANAQIITAVASLFAGHAKFGPLGMGLAAAAVMGLYAAISSAPKLETGGVVKETGMAVVHKGEVFSGTRNEMGMGSGETNRLLKELIKQQIFLHNRLTNRIGDIALSSPV